MISCHASQGGKSAYGAAFTVCIASCVHLHGRVFFTHSLYFKMFLENRITIPVVSKLHKMAIV
jgi:hypothetical protein